MKSVTPRCPYCTGTEISLKFSDNLYKKAKILDVNAFTLSCVMVVQFLEPPPFNQPNDDEYIVKLYDRRFAKQLREEQEAALWNSQTETEYREFVQTSQVARLFEHWSAKFGQSEYWYFDEPEELDQVQLEAYLQFLCHRTYNIEKHAYELMEDMQGTRVPRLFSHVLLPSSVESDQKSNSLSKYLDSPGIILQYVKGFALKDLGCNLPPEMWQPVCDEAINIVHRIGERGICNRDVKTRSFIVENETLKVFMVDFGLCNFRSQARDDRMFRSWQADEDEEGAVGLMMQTYLGECQAGTYVYQRSDRALSLVHEFKRAGLSDGEADDIEEEKAEGCSNRAEADIEIPRPCHDAVSSTDETATREEAQYHRKTGQSVFTGPHSPNL